MSSFKEFYEFQKKRAYEKQRILDDLNSSCPTKYRNGLGLMNMNANCIPTFGSVNCQYEKFEPTNSKENVNSNKVSKKKKLNNNQTKKLDFEY